MRKDLLKDDVGGDYDMVMINENPTDFDSMENDISWIDRALNGDGNEDSYSDFPPIPDFSCMYSSSSSSSRPPAAAPPTVPPAYKLVPTLSSCSSVSSSSAVSLAVLRTDADKETELNHCFHYQHQQVDVPVEISNTGSGECTDVMEDFEFMDLIDDDNNDIFQDDVNFQVYQEQQNSELVMIFFEWLKQNKDHISAEDMRSIKLSRSNVEIALKHLGTTDEGKKQLLKFILVWVDQYHLHRKRTGETDASGNNFQNQDPNSNTNSIPPPDYFNPSFSPSPWMGHPPPPPPPPPPPYGDKSGAIMGPPPGFFAPGIGYVGDPGAIYPPFNQPVNYGNPNLINPEFEAVDSTQSWQQSQLPMRSQSVPLPNNNISFSIAAPPPPAFYRSQYPYEVLDKNGKRLVRFDSAATKEARKKRMARQRRVLSHHFRHQNSSKQTDENEMDDDDELIIIDGYSNISSPSPSDPVYWSSSMAMAPPPEAYQPVPMAMPPNYQLQAPSDQRQEWQTDNNFGIGFLLQKALKTSDVNNLGRIVLPKKEAEMYLPGLDSGDGIILPLKEFESSKVWNMRYRFWLNNKTRMYLLENTGEFVQAHGLQEGDFIMLYADLRRGKYLIRSVKVREAVQKVEKRKYVLSKRIKRI